jgi:hypothetical protein
MNKKERIEEARKTYGDEIVAQTIEIVAISDPDAAYAYFDDCGMDEHCECVEIIYFNAD